MGSAFLLVNLMNKILEENVCRNVIIIKLTLMGNVYVLLVMLKNLINAQSAHQNRLKNQENAFAIKLDIGLMNQNSFVHNNYPVVHQDLNGIKGSSNANASIMDNI